MNKLTIGSKCIVYSLTSHNGLMKSSGTFKGFVAVGEDTSLCLELDKAHGKMEGKIRLIPIGSIAAIDILEFAEEEEEDDEGEKLYYS